MGGIHNAQGCSQRRPWKGKAGTDEEAGHVPKVHVPIYRSLPEEAARLGAEGGHQREHKR